MRHVTMSTLLLHAANLLSRSQYTTLTQMHAKNCFV